ncbi:hypothetical protein SAMN05216323_10672 [Williamwhitmania taraxaci]|uniref:Uncharacterized protein n=1 Tax=Williamwhitmania taraxaci TaxID=1640674 RepID=A0A1G6QXJ2_9BACT|nr:hypothetical protein SAMN05216323_10672 [Williamwhitmania taraxaci]
MYLRCFCSVLFHSFSLQPVKEPLPIYCSPRLPLTLGNSVSWCSPIPLVGVAKVILFFVLPNFRQSFFSSPRSAETLADALFQSPILLVNIPSERVQK